MHSMHTGEKSVKLTGCTYKLCTGCITDIVKEKKLQLIGNFCRVRLKAEYVYTQMCPCRMLRHCEFILQQLTYVLYIYMCSCAHMNS